MDAWAFVRGALEVKAEVVVVGGGLAGSAAAIGLARARRDMLLPERDSQAQHKVCGEFPSRDALRYLKLLGLNVSERQPSDFRSDCVGSSRCKSHSQLWCREG